MKSVNDILSMGEFLNLSYATQFANHIKAEKTNKWFIGGKEISSPQLKHTTIAVFLNNYNNIEELLFDATEQLKKIINDLEGIYTIYVDSITASRSKLDKNLLFFTVPITLATFDCDVQEEGLSDYADIVFDGFKQYLEDNCIGDTINCHFSEDGDVSEFVNNEQREVIIEQTYLQKEFLNRVASNGIKIDYESLFGALDEKLPEDKRSITVFSWVIDIDKSCCAITYDNNGFIKVKFSFIAYKSHINSVYEDLRGTEGQTPCKDITDSITAKNIDDNSTIKINYLEDNGEPKEENSFYHRKWYIS